MSERRHLRSVPPVASREPETPESQEHEAMVRNCALRVMRELRLPSAELDDLVHDGTVGLLEAKSRFDPVHGVKFEAFAYPRVRGAIIDGVARLKRHTRKVHAACKRLALMDGVMEEAGVERAERDHAVDPEAVSGAIDAMLHGLAASFVLSSVAEVERSESPEDANIRRLDSRKLHSAVRALPDEDQTLLHALYVEDRVLEDVGSELGISKGQASRRHAKVLERLHARLT